MVKGLQLFKEHFRDFKESFVVIGGTACDRLFAEQSIPFRVTKDVDMVLVIETLDDAFVRRFWEFIQAGSYRKRQRSEKRQYYRFQNPARIGYPDMLELFSRRLEQMDIGVGQTITIIPAGEDLSSLSAILMDSAYYELIKGTKTILDDLPILQANGLIPLKARAWLDLTERKANGERIKELDIKKHRNDVFRLSLILVDPPFTLADSIRIDLQRFIAGFPLDSKEWPHILASLGETTGVQYNPAELVNTLVRHFEMTVSS